MASYHDLGVPPSLATVTVKIFDIIQAGDHDNVKAPATGAFEPVLSGHEYLKCPIFTFYIEHAPTQQHVLFDLGMRKDLENCAPQVSTLLQKAFPVKTDIVDLIEADGIGRESINAVIWSHSHVDHTGDISRFPSSTSLVISEELALETYETDPSSTLLPSDVEGRTIKRVSFDLKIGDFNAHDYFGDGSLYLLAVPGHQVGHLCGLARTTPTSFVLMGADSCHHIGALRPTALLHRNYPCPAALTDNTKATVSNVHFGESGTENAFDLKAQTDPLLRINNSPYHADATVAHRSAHSLTAFDANPDVLVILAHDSSVLPLFRQMPVTLDDWKTKGWKEMTVWAFLNADNPAFRFSEG
ncbi:Metallo-beta-lactamase superfamily protein [Mycena indigotica]|uniref:Metallo-beta-lactamase superfamily protein n=1 Tax=Mycena indigotica TaxID=2126181 RepID=A0A8H6RYX3_9AGAR|nr:Metallo-beta-lactamase superfamily protein [Mycena indigotica]KAF7289879.1 Metallo-beta-lactamase superfamily protein [Mycena indigotica]